MRAYLIDTPNKQIVEIDYSGDWRTIKQHLHCDLFTTVALDSTGDTVYVDDEGLINGNPHGWFVLRDYHQPLRGYGLVLGLNANGESIAPHATQERLERLVFFPSTVNESAIDRTITIRAL